MELETNQAVIKKGKQTSKMTIVLGILLVAIPVCVALFICMPDLLMTLKGSLGEITKGAIMGVSSLPVLLFIGIKGGATWYKKVWCWIVLALMLVGILCTVFLGKAGASAMPGGGPMPEDPGQNAVVPMG